MSNEVLSILTICVPIITALVSGILSYMLAVKNSNKEIEKVREQHKNELESMKENHKLEMEKLNNQQNHEKQMKNQEIAGQIGAGLFSKMFENPTVQDLLGQEITKAFNKKEK